MSERAHAITKELSANDTGETGGHQAGILVPKDPRILSFFPPLGIDEKNPRHHLVFYDETRNEFRLTRMTPYIKGNGLQAGDHIALRRDPETGRRFISYRRARAVQRTESGRL